MKKYDCSKNCPFRSLHCHSNCETYAKRLKQQEKIEIAKGKERLLTNYTVNNIHKRYERKKGE